MKKFIINSLDVVNIDNPVPPTPIKKMVENARKVVKLVCNNKVKHTAILIDENSIEITLTNDVISVNVYFSRDTIKIERHVGVFDEFNGDTINDAVTLLKKWFSEHSESKGYFCLEN